MGASAEVTPSLIPDQFFSTAALSPLFPSIVNILRFSQQPMEIASHHRRRVKTQGSLPSAQAAELLLFGLIISGQIHMRRIDGWQELKQVPVLNAA